MSATTEGIRRVLIVGSWAKEEITAEHLKATSGVEVLAYMDTRNPGLMARADAYEVGPLSDVDSITAFAEDRGCDLVLPTTAEPLQHGLADRLEEAGIPVFGPKREAARLEFDKAFAREVVQACAPEAVPAYRVFTDPAEAEAYASGLDWQVAVKPIGLTDGLGVRVWGDQLPDEKAVRDYIREICREGIGGKRAVLVEERLVGEEFTLQTLVDDERLVATVPVQDFKKLLPGERGPNTASMGSYSGPGGRLAFLDEARHAAALGVMRRTLKEARERIGFPLRGFLYGQFMATADGIRLIEYNFRPGDPEWVNTLAILETPLLGVIGGLLSGHEPELRQSSEATVCKYIVPEAYPYEPDQELPVTVDEDAVRELGVGLYHSCGETKDGTLRVGSERGLAFVARDRSVEGAHGKVEEAIRKVRGSFVHRPDIGTPELVQSKVRHLRRLAGQAAILRNAEEDDFLDMAGLASSCPPLEPYPPHLYRIILRFFRPVCLVAEADDGRKVGFAMALAAMEPPGTLFLWQIGVVPDMQGSGLGRRILEQLEAQALGLGFWRIEATVDPLNEPSRRLFESAGYRNASSKEPQTVTVNGLLAATDHYRPGRHFLVLERKLRPSGNDR
jgi:phosphoribosylamine---glycine ligase